MEKGQNTNCKPNSDDRFFSGGDYAGGLGDLSSRVLWLKLECSGGDLAEPFGAAQ